VTLDVGLRTKQQRMVDKDIKRQTVYAVYFSMSRSRYCRHRYVQEALLVGYFSVIIVSSSALIFHGRFVISG
jgi:hypothetical protein